MLPGQAAITLNVKPDCRSVPLTGSEMIAENYRPDLMMLEII
jgi:hypothetical protein